MATVLETTAPRKPRAYYATLHGLAGVLTRPADRVLFLEHESGAVVTVTQADMPHVVVLGEVVEAMAQYIEDLARGGAAAIACSRAN
jgi:hypothetical protein